MINTCRLYSNIKNNIQIINHYIYFLNSGQFLQTIFNLYFWAVLTALREGEKQTHTACSPACCEKFFTESQSGTHPIHSMDHHLMRCSLSDPKCRWFWYPLDMTLPQFHPYCIWYYCIACHWWSRDHWLKTSCYYTAIIKSTEQTVACKLFSFHVI